MKIGVVNEGSTKFHNADVIKSLDGFGHQVFNLGMRDVPGEPDLTYIETGLIAALALNLKAVDFVVGGCGTGQGFMNSVLQYPGVACGLLYDPVESWLFSQVNAGNCISLQLNKGYGRLAGDINLRFIFEKLFNNTYGQGYPAARGEIQKKARIDLAEISCNNHHSMEDILATMDPSVVKRALGFPGIIAFIEEEAIESELKIKVKGMIV